VNENFRQRCARLWQAEFCSPKDFVRRAAVITFLFLVAHGVGLREYTSFLSGTAPSPDLGWKLTIFFGLLYLVFYFALVLFVPIFLLAAFLQRAIQSFLNRR